MHRAGLSSSWAPSPWHRGASQAMLKEWPTAWLALDPAPGSIGSESCLYLPFHCKLLPTHPSSSVYKKIPKEILLQAAQCMLVVWTLA